VQLDEAAFFGPTELGEERAIDHLRNLEDRAHRVAVLSGQETQWRA
jgi:hypothetical protein